MKLILGNALDLKLLPESVDMVFLDPPYRVISGGNGPSSWMHGQGGILAANDGKIFRHNDIEFSDYLPMLYRVMKQSAHIYLMTNFDNLFEARNELVNAGFSLHNLLIWKKQNCTPNRWYMKDCEYVIFGRKGKAKTINHPGSKTVMEFTNPTGGKSHPTEKPVELIRHLIRNSTLPGQLVLDPFMGSGASAVAAKAEGRRFIGVEIDPEYYEVARARTRNTD